jgi:S-(hydroxymethyl)glutathione dehydrogenase/alcohol dehydrogenase
MEPEQTLGHEFMGIVQEIGSSIKEVKKRWQSWIPFNISCGSCWFCRHELCSQYDRSNPNEEFGAAYGYTKLMGVMMVDKQNLYEYPLQIQEH